MLVGQFIHSDEYLTGYYFKRIKGHSGVQAVTRPFQQVIYLRQDLYGGAAENVQLAFGAAGEVAIGAETAIAQPGR